MLISVSWPSGEVKLCKSFYSGSNPLETSSSVGRSIWAGSDERNNQFQILVVQFTDFKMLSKKCQYALHALKFMAQHPVDNLLTIKEIATAENIPKKFLEAILLELKTAGFLFSKKGNVGGYCLSRDPSQITLLEVIRVIDGAVAMLPCVSLHFYESCGFCDDEKSCGINAVFSKVRDETLKILSATTVSDLTAGVLIEHTISRKKIN